MLALEGRVVTMDANDTVLDHGRVYVDGPLIAGVDDANLKPIPPKFQKAKIVKTGGTIYPGLIELHNHLAYNILPLWQVDKKYSDRAQWRRAPGYHEAVVLPMAAIGATQRLLPSVVRYVESKCLVGGVTTSQGIKLASNGGISKYFRGIIRVAEHSDAKNMPAANTSIGDVAKSAAADFAARLRTESCMLLHCSEGTGKTARQHFLDLKLSKGWALAPSFAGIHCNALRAEDFKVIKQYGGHVVWSPLSNLLLYGETAQMKEVRDAGLTIGLGSDWSYSGSKNLLSELKIASRWSAANGDIFSAKELVAMATRNAAQILGWAGAVGSLEQGKRADLIVVDDRRHDPFDELLHASEATISLVVIDGAPRYGYSAMMDACGAAGEVCTVAGKRRKVAAPTNAGPIEPVSLKTATATLKTALSQLPALIKDAKRNVDMIRRSLAVQRSPANRQWYLALDELTPLVPPSRRVTVPPLAYLDLLDDMPVRRVPQGITLDPLSVADDQKYYSELADEPNLPPYMVKNIESLYTN